MVALIFIIFIIRVTSWYEPAINVSKDPGTNMRFKPQESESSNKNDYLSEGDGKQIPEAQSNPDPDLSISDIDERINEYPPREIVSSQDKLIPIADDVMIKMNKIDELTKALNKKLGTGNLISGIHDKNAWKRFYNHLRLNFKDLMIDGHLSIELHIRYVLCCYVVIFIPGQFAFPFPAFYKVFIPKKAMKIPILGDALRGLDRFLTFVSDNNTKTFIITFYVGRQNSLVEDIEFVPRIPDLIFTDPLAILRELLKFEIRSEGYDNKKEL